MLETTKVLLKIYPELNLPSIKIRLLEQTKEEVKLSTDTNINVMQIYYSIFEDYLKSFPDRYTQYIHITGPTPQPRMSTISRLHPSIAYCFFSATPNKCYTFEEKQDAIAYIDYSISATRTNDYTVKLTSPIVAGDVTELCEAIPELNTPINKVRILYLIYAQSYGDLFTKTRHAYDALIYVISSFNTPMYTVNVNIYAILHLVGITRERYVNEFDKSIRDITCWGVESNEKFHNRYIVKLIEELSSE